jgi:ribosomal protein S18 acetylase RimI-like enzyme
MTEILDYTSLQSLLSADPDHLHVHVVDMPYRLTSTWQELGCELKLWKSGDAHLAWAVFQPPWWNLDYGIHPSERGSSLEKEVFAWGKQQMIGYAKRSGEDFYGSVEFFEDAPDTERTIGHLVSLGFEKFDWSIILFEKDLNREIPPIQLPEGFSIRPLRENSEVDAYVKLHRVVFNSDKMTKAWRSRMLQHPAYKPGLDLVVLSAEDKPVGFCVCWLCGGIGKIEPLGVHPDFQGLGLGSALEHAEFHALREEGARYVQVDHVSTNDVAIALARKSGFNKSIMPSGISRKYVLITANGDSRAQL